MKENFKSITQNQESSNLELKRLEHDEIKRNERGGVEADQ